MANVEITVQSRLAQVTEDLKAIQSQMRESTESAQQFGENVGETHKRKLQETQGFLGRLSTMSSRVFKNLGDDFSAMLGAVGVSEGLRMGRQFRESVEETVMLSDAIRKLGPTFGLTRDRFTEFQTRLTEGLGEIGLGADEAISALQGLSRTQVRGQETLSEYARTAGQLAAATGTKGQEGAITEGIARVITARGGDVQNLDEMRQVAEDLRRAYNATGQIPAAIVQSLERVIAQMPSDLRKGISTSGLVQLGTVAQVAGPNATAFLEEFLGKSPVARKALEARGFGDVFGPEGFDIDAFRRAAKGIIDAFPDDPRLMAQTLGLTEEGAEGFVRLYESLDRVTEAQEAMTRDTRGLANQYRDAMGAAEAFRASLNRVKSSLAEPLSFITGTVTEGLKSASETAVGSAAVVGGAGLLATILAGGGIRAIGGALRGKGTGIAERETFERVSGEQSTPVYVVNAAEIGQASGSSIGPTIMGGMRGLATMVGKVGLVGAAAAGGYAAGAGINKLLEGTAADQWLNDALGTIFGAIEDEKTRPKEKTTARTSENMPEFFDRLGTPGFSQNYSRRNQESFKLTAPTKPQKVQVKVDVESKSKDLKATARPSRGGAQ